MICDKYTLVSLFIANIINIIQLVLYNTCMIMNYDHPDIYLIRSLIYTKIVYDIFNFYKLRICFVHLNNTLPIDVTEFIKYGSRFIHIPQISSLFTYYRIYTLYDKIQTYTNPLMYTVYMLNYYISYIVVYGLYISLFMFMVIIFSRVINKMKYATPRKQSRLQSRPPIYSPTNDVCSICLDIDCNYKTICGHFFHNQCIFRWVTISNKYECPICRNNIRHQPN